jgi:hypothetical protein
MAIDKNAFLTLLFPLQLIFGDVIQRQTNYTFLNQGYVFESLAATGYNQQFLTKIYTIGSDNPASLSDFSQFTLGFSYQFSSEINPAYQTNPGSYPQVSFTHERAEDALPQSLGIAIPFSKFCFGIGLSQRYSSSWGLFDRTTFEQAGLSMIEKTIVLAQINILTYKNSNLFRTNDSFSFGIKFSNNFLRSEVINMSDSNIGIYDYNVAVGFRYKTGKLGFGIHYESNSVFEKEKTRSNYSFLSTGALPSSINSGILWNPIQRLNVTLNASLIFWERIPSSRQNEFRNYKNQVITAINACYSLYPVAITMGILSTNRNYTEQSEENNSRFDYKVIMPIIGLNVSMFDFQADICYANSTFFSAEWQKQHIVKFAIGFKI